MRQADEEIKTQEPAGKSGRDMTPDDDPNRIPDPSEYLSAENLFALEFAGKTVDTYYKSLGYADWADFWAKAGKAHFVGEEKEE